jgi:hypothetical protein
MKAFLICACAFAPKLFAQTFAGTTLLEPSPDFSAAMVAGVDQFFLRKTVDAKAARAAHWPGDAAKHRERLRAIIGAVDARLSVRGLSWSARWRGMRCFTMASSRVFKGGAGRCSTACIASDCSPCRRKMREQRDAHELHPHTSR